MTKTVLAAILAPAEGLPMHQNSWWGLRCVPDRGDVCLLLFKLECLPWLSKGTGIREAFRSEKVRRNKLRLGGAAVHFWLDIISDCRCYIRKTNSEA
ncbi:hypothetical protein F5Y01DRAFT_300887 [Xylaria sp. FL0043]|nr:hypothetical protein F5Y01DRAFT_300887 [Xylaria sp. FL0043]